MPRLNLKKIKPMKFIKDNIVEIVLMATGLIFFIQPTYSNVKISFTLLFIGSFLILFLYKEPERMKQFNYPSFEAANFFPKNTNKVYYFREKKMSTEERFNQKLENFKNGIIDLKEMNFSMSDKIVFGLIIWTLVLFFITATNQFEIYFVIIFLSILVTKEFTNVFTTSVLKKRMNVFIIVFIMAYLYIVTQKFLMIP